MKRYNVNYSTTTSHDTVVRAKNAREAEEKVREVIGDPVDIDGVYEVKSHD